MGMPVEGSYSQDGFRFRNDDGSETTATWLATAGTNITIDTDVTVRLRIRVQQTVTDMTENAGNIERNFKVRFSRNGGAYTDVAAGAAVEYASSANVANGDATTTQLAGDGTYIAGVIDNSNDTGLITFDQGGLQYTELEFILVINGGVVANNDTLDFRVYETSDVALNNYTATPRATATVAVNVDENLTRNEKTTSYQEFTLDATSNVNINLARNEKTTSYQELDLGLVTPFETDLALVTLNTSYQEFTFDKTDNSDVNLTRNEKTLNFIELTFDAQALFDLTRNEKTLNFIELTLDATSNVDTNLARNEKTTSYQEFTFDKTDNSDVNLTRSEKTTSYQEFTFDAVVNFETDLSITTSNIQYQELEFVVIANLDTNLVRNEKIVQYQALAIRTAIHNLTTSDITSISARFNWEYDENFA